MHTCHKSEASVYMDKKLHTFSFSVFDERAPQWYRWTVAQVISFWQMLMMSSARVKYQFVSSRCELNG